MTLCMKTVRAKKVAGIVVMTDAEERKNLDAIVTMLNDESGPEADWQGKSYVQGDVVKLRRLLTAFQKAEQAWQEAQQNIQKVKRTETARKQLMRAWQEAQPKYEPKDLADVEHFYQEMQGRGLYVDRDGNFTVLDDYPQPYDPALIQFTRFRRNSQRWRLADPCQHCGRSFLKRTRRETRMFCSRQCAAAAAQAARRERKREEKLKRARQLLKRARQALRNYKASPPKFRKLDWKEYVTQAEPSISKKFLTMAVEKGDLKPPKLPQPQLKQRRK